MAPYLSDLNMGWKKHGLEGVNPAAGVKVGRLGPVAHRAILDTIMIELG